MKITAFAIGSYGDVRPFIELGRELVNRGHQYALATFKGFQTEIEAAGLNYRKITGDSEQFTSRLLSDSSGKSNDEIKGIKTMLKENPGLFDDFNNAAVDNDLLIYMQFGAIAYHFAEKYQTPCIRTFVFPFDASRHYSPMVPEAKENTWLCKLSHHICVTGMGYAAIDAVNQYRIRLGLKKWSIFRSYKKMNNRLLPTLYQYSEVLAKRDPSWGSHIHITGTWDGAPVEFQPEPEIEKFLESGSPPLYICFGSMVTKRIENLHKTIIEALRKTEQRAIIALPRELEAVHVDDKSVFYTGFIPYSWLFPKVEAAIHHGGAGTTHHLLRLGKPMYIIAFGADQVFWGRRVAQLGAGLEPHDLRNEELTVAGLVDNIKELKKNKYTQSAVRVADRLKGENGVCKAADIIEQYLKEKRHE